MKELAKFNLGDNKSNYVIEKCHINVSQENDNIYVIFLVRQMAVKVGFKQTDEIMIATAASELATNILRYAHDGEITVSIIKNTSTDCDGIELFASDTGPGIADLEAAMREHYSSLPHSLGLGLPSVKRIMDEFFIESILGKGTKVLARRWNMTKKR